MNLNSLWQYRNFRLLLKILEKDNLLCHVCPSVRPSLRPSVRLSASPLGTTLLQLNGFPLNLIFHYYCQIMWLKHKFNWNLTTMSGTVHGDWYTVLITFLLRTRNVSDKSSGENRNTHFVYNDNFFPNIMQFMRKCGKYCREGHGTDENMTHAYFILDT